MSLQYKFSSKTIIEEGRTTKASIDEIQKWLPTETSFLPKVPDEFIVLFLISCNNDIELTKKTIKAYFRIKNRAPEIFSDRDMDRDDLQKIMKVIVCSSLPARMENNTVVHFFKLIDTDYRKCDIVPATKIAFMLLGISQKTNPPNELVVVVDMKGVNFMHLTCIKMGVIKTFLDFVQEALPLKIKAVHVLNTNYLFDKILSIIKIFIRSELMKIIIPHPSNMEMDTFFKDHVPSSCMPEEYGGDLASCDVLNQKTVEQLKDLKEFFDAEEKLVDQFKND